MKLTLPKEKLLKALDTIQVKGKYLTSSGLKTETLGDCVQIISLPPSESPFKTGWMFYNGNDQTYVEHWVVGLPDKKGEVVLEIDRLKKYISRMNGNITLNIDDVCEIISDNKRATIPIVVIHPNLTAISRLETLTSKINYGELDSEIIFGKNVKYENGFSIIGSKLKKVITNCETVGHGKYCFEIKENQVIISSSKLNESYFETFDDMNIKGENVKIYFTSPVHQPFTNTDKINIYFNEESPIVMVSNNTLLIRAPYVETD